MNPLTFFPEYENFDLTDLSNSNPGQNIYSFELGVKVLSLICEQKITLNQIAYIYNLPLNLVKDWYLICEKNNFYLTELLVSQFCFSIKEKQPDKNKQIIVMKNSSTPTCSVNALDSKPIHKRVTKKYSADVKEEFLTRINNGENIKEVSKKMDIKYNTSRNWRFSRDSRIGKKRIYKYPDNIKSLFIERTNNGESLKEVSSELDINYSSSRNWAPVKNRRNRRPKPYSIRQQMLNMVKNNPDMTPTDIFNHLNVGHTAGNKCLYNLRKAGLLPGFSKIRKYDKKNINENYSNSNIFHEDLLENLNFVPVSSIESSLEANENIQSIVAYLKEGLLLSDQISLPIEDNLDQIVLSPQSQENFFKLPETDFFHKKNLEINSFSYINSTLRKK